MKHKMRNKNFDQGIFEVEIPELGNPIRGKVRDNWVVKTKKSEIRVMVTTDRQGFMAKPICTIAGKGQIANLMSAYWFECTKNIVPNHVVSIIHPNVLIAKQAKEVIPIEVVLRRYMAKGSTKTSLYHNYIELGRRKIYGIEFPDNLIANQELPMGTIITPTTKASNGDDEELTDEEAMMIVESRFGAGMWSKIKKYAREVFEFARIRSLEKGLILVDTKFEFGIDTDGNIMLIDELLTSENSRFWLLEDHRKKLGNEEDIDFDKNVLSRRFAKNQISNKTLVNLIDSKVLQKMLYAYEEPYKIITGKNLTISDPKTIREKVLEYLQREKYLSI